MTASDPTLPTRQAIVTHLRADTNVTTLGSPSLGTRIYGERAPGGTLSWPFVRYGQTDMGQLGGPVPIHVFSKKQHTDEAATIMAAIVESLGGKTLELEDGRKIRLNYPDAGGSQIIPDAAEADAWHGIVRFDAFIPRACPV
jgi:hypothetical protein